MTPWTLTQSMPRLGERLGIDLHVIRDDLYPAHGGGNKARKVAFILAAEENVAVDALVTVGGTQSNQARVVALEAAARGWPCELILHGDPEDLANPMGNLKLMAMSGAHISIVPVDQVGDRVEAVIQRFQDQGRTPLEVPGGHP